jgi:phage-related protein
LQAKEQDMANKVAVIESEYSTLENNLGNAHDDCMEQLSGMIASLQTLTGKGGGIHTDQLSPKIEALIGEMQSVKGTIQEIFTTSEELVKSFQTVVGDYDTLC